MAIKITTPTNGGDSVKFGSGVTAIAAEVTGSEVSSGEGKLEFKTTTGGTSATKATILANGNVGIGVTAPYDPLTVAGDVRIKASGGRLTYFNSDAAYSLGSSGGAAIRFVETAGSQEIAFETHETGVSHAERMRITKNGTVNLSVPLPVASGGTGATSGVQIVRQHYIPSTGGIVTAAGNSTWNSISTSATISVTSGNILTIWWVAGIYARAAGHWSGTVFLNGTNVQSGNWGNGINHGSGTTTGWYTTTGIARKVIPATGNHVLELKLKANTGNMDINRDGNLGYDGAYMIVQETTP